MHIRSCRDEILRIDMFNKLGTLSGPEAYRDHNQFSFAFHTTEFRSRRMRVRPQITDTAGHKHFMAENSIKLVFAERGGEKSSN